MKTRFKTSLAILLAVLLTGPVHAGAVLSERAVRNLGVDAPERNSSGPATNGVTTMSAVAFLLTFGFTAPGAAHFVTVPGIANLEECQYLAKQLIVSANPQFKCTAYKMAVPENGTPTR